VRRLEADEWKLFREVRLAALRDAPYAFGSTYEGEVGASESSWRSRLEARTRFVAQSGREVVGTVAGGSSGLSGIAALTALWVAPAARGRGVGEALVSAVLAWAQDSDYEQVVLWVVEGNSPAERLYDRIGFKRTGAAQPVRPGDDRIEYEMSRSL
jgi:ribosomal protein S18 acetylase RimI-like enzyme